MPRTKVIAAAALAGLVLSGCVASRYRISDALSRYGLTQNQASCAAEFLHGHLSNRQVDRLARAATYYRGDGRLTFGDLVRVAGSLDDPKVALEVGAAALACRVAADIPIGL